MNFYELPDKDFDEKFRTAADSAGYPFNEEAWKGLEKKLGWWEKFGPAFWKLSGGLIMILLGMMVFLIMKNPEAGESETSISQIAWSEINDADRRNGAGIPVPVGNGSEFSGRNWQVTYGEEMEIPEMPLALNSRVGKQTEQGVSSGVGTVLKQNERVGPGAGPMEMVKNISSAGPVNDRNEDDRARNSTLNSWNFPETVGIIGMESIGLQQHPEFPDSRSENKKTAEAPLYPVEKSKAGFGYSLNLMIGPDFSGVGAGSYGTGTFTGFGLEIFMGNRFSLMVGISHARKKYAVQDEYTIPYPEYSSYGQGPDNVDIACHVIDIPLNIYYSVFMNGKNRIFAGAGLSTYLMLTEEYHFEYDGYVYNDPVIDYTVKNENQHYFGILNLSAGYSRKMGSRWSWQVEPYFKLPIQDIAAAKVRLNSLGALISLKYRLR
jgi:hypothetical protein